MNPESPELLKARQAIETYAAYDPAVWPADIDPAQLQAWLAACENAPDLDARATYMLASLEQEVAMNYGPDDPDAARQLFRSAEQRYATLAQHPNLDRLLRHKAALGATTAYWFETMTIGGHITSDHHGLYLDALRAATIELDDDPTDEELHYIDTLCAILAFNEWSLGHHTDTNVDRLFVPALPRFAEHPEGWHLDMYVIDENVHHAVRIADAPNGRFITLFPHELSRPLGSRQTIAPELIACHMAADRAKKRNNLGRVHGIEVYYSQMGAFKKKTNAAERTILAQIGNPRQPEVYEEYISPYEPEAEWYLGLGRQFTLPEAVADDLARHTNALEQKRTTGGLDTTNLRILGWMHTELVMLGLEDTTEDKASSCFTTAMEQAMENNNLAEVYSLATELHGLPLYKAAASGQELVMTAVAAAYREALAEAAGMLLAQYRDSADNQAANMQGMHRQLQFLTTCLLLTEPGVMVAAPAPARLALQERMADSCDIIVWELTLAQRRTDAFKYRTERGLRLEPTDIKRSADHIAVVAPVILKQHKPGHDFAVLTNSIENTLQAAPLTSLAISVRQALEKRLWPERTLRIPKTRSKK